MTTSSLFGILTIIALVLVFVFATIAFVFTNRLLNRKNAPMSEEVGSIFAVLSNATCASGLYWYQVNYNGIVGWTPEGGSGQYWVEPL